ncbi:magnesium and cobalt transport protein CorA [Microbacterium sp. X-17]|uniref:magnesium and cobalt transport protein CorA n=1 Tax=Microbacterium sp. X-17 TaxID=3144404 RepID=UPI0031F50F73
MLLDSAIYRDGAWVSGGMSPLEAIETSRGGAGDLVWIGLLRPEPSELQQLAEALDLHPLAVQDCLRGHQRSKLEQFGDMTFLVLQPAVYDDDKETVTCSEVSLFVGRDFVLSVHNDRSVDVTATRHRLERHPEILRRGPYVVVWAICEQVIADYTPVLLGVENDIDQIEVDLFSELHASAVSKRIFALQREVIDLQHATTPLGEMLDRLQVVVEQMTGSAQTPALQDLDDRAQHVVDKVEVFRSTLDSAMAVHSTLVEEQNNAIMREMTEQGLEQADQSKKVAAWAAILFAPSLVAGIYGMNFDNMPELHWEFGYPMALLIMVGFSTTLYIVFKRRGWL